MMWLGAMLAVGGIVWMGSRSFRHSQPSYFGTTLSPQRSLEHARHRWIASNWPGWALALLGVGIVLVSEIL